MSDAALRDLERRWRSSGLRSDRDAWLAAQARFGAGGVVEARALARRIGALARELPDDEAPPIEAWAAWALRELGEPDAAAALAGELAGRATHQSLRTAVPTLARAACAAGDLVLLDRALARLVRERLDFNAYQGSGQLVEPWCRAALELGAPARLRLRLRGALLRSEPRWINLAVVAPSLLELEPAWAAERVRESIPAAAPSRQAAPFGANPGPLPNSQGPSVSLLFGLLHDRVRLTAADATAFLDELAARPDTEALPRLRWGEARALVTALRLEPRRAPGDSRASTRLVWEAARRLAVGEPLERLIPLLQQAPVSPRGIHATTNAIFTLVEGLPGAVDVLRAAWQHDPSLGGLVSVACMRTPSDDATWELLIEVVGSRVDDAHPNALEAWLNVLATRREANAEARALHEAVDARLARLLADPSLGAALRPYPVAPALRQALFASWVARARLDPSLATPPPLDDPRMTPEEQTLLLLRAAGSIGALAAPARIRLAEAVLDRVHLPEGGPRASGLPGPGHRVPRLLQTLCEELPRQPSE